MVSPDCRFNKDSTLLLILFVAILDQSTDEVSLRYQSIRFCHFVRDASVKLLLLGDRDESLIEYHSSNFDLDKVVGATRGDVDEESLEMIKEL